MLETGSRCVLTLLGTSDTLSEIEATIEGDLGDRWKVSAAGASFDVPKEWVRPVPPAPDASQRGR